MFFCWFLFGWELFVFFVCVLGFVFFIIWCKGVCVFFWRWIIWVWVVLVCLLVINIFLLVRVWSSCWNWVMSFFWLVISILCFCGLNLKWIFLDLLSLMWKVFLLVVWLMERCCLNSMSMCCWVFVKICLLIGMKCVIIVVLFCIWNGWSWLFVVLIWGCLDNVNLFWFLMCVGLLFFRFGVILWFFKMSFSVCLIWCCWFVFVRIKIVFVFGFGWILILFWENFCDNLRMIILFNLVGNW